MPCYNESQSIPYLYQKSLYLTSNYDMEIIFVDNGSQDDTWKIMKSFEAIDKIRFVNLKKNKGYGYGIKYGFNFCKGKYIGWTHADLQTDLFDLIKAYDVMQEIFLKNKNSHKYVFKGKRLGRSTFDNLVSKSMSLLAKFIFLSTNFQEINAQPSIFHKSIIASLNNAPNDYNFDLGSFIIANSNNCKFVRFPVLFPKRKYGKSHWNVNISSKLKFIVNTFFAMLSMKFNKKFIN